MNALLQYQFFRTLTLKVGIATGVGVDLQIVNMENPLNTGINKVTVVRDE